MTKRIDELIQTICGAAGHPLALFLHEWCEESRPFFAFAEAHATKIRKKARLASLDDELADVLAELAIAALLLRDRRFGARYEPFRGTGQRGPDLEVIFKTHAPLFVEVTRLRLPRASADDTAGAALKLARVMCDKIEQFPAGVMNLLVAVVPPDAVSDALVPAAIRPLEIAPQREAGLQMPEPRLAGARTFLRQRERLSAIALCLFTPDWRPLVLKLWPNPQAKHRLRPEIARFLAH